MKVSVSYSVTAELFISFKVDLSERKTWIKIHFAFINRNPKPQHINGTQCMCRFCSPFLSVFLRPSSVLRYYPIC